MKMLRRVRRVLRNLAAPPTCSSTSETALVLLGGMTARQMQNGPINTISDAEFRVFSQFGEDGIIQHLIRHVPIESEVFVEFGVENYRESNTRFLLLHNNWCGVVIDGNASNVDQIRSDAVHWRHGLTAITSHITVENINSLVHEHVKIPDIGLLSIDIDGNDYWVWKELSAVTPRIVICEYNSVLGSERALTTPYAPHFERFNAHFSGLYFGASLAALVALGRSKGYAFIGANSHGSNAFFVRRDVLGNLRELSVEDGFRLSRFQDSRDRAGKLSFKAGTARRELLKGLPFVDVQSGKTILLDTE